MGTRSAVAPVKNQSLWRLPQMRQLLAISLLGFTSFCLTLAAVPTWAHAGGVAESAAGLPTTVMLASTVLTQAAVPRLVTRFGVGRTLAAGLVALGAPAPFCALSHQLAVLLPVAAVRGCGFAVLTVVGATLTATVAPPDRHGESVGLYGLAIAVPNLLGIPAGVALTQLGGFGWVASGAAIPVLAVPLALSLGRSIERNADNSGATVSSSLSARRTVAVVLAPAMVLLVVTLAGGGLITYLPIQRPSGVFATVVLLLFGACAALARWRVGAIADRVGTTVLLPVSVGAGAVGVLLVAAGLAAGSSADALVLVGAVAAGAGYGAVQNLTLVVAFLRAGPGRSATASAVWNAAFDSGTAIGAVAIGATAAAGLGVPGAFAASAGLVAVSLPLAWWMRPAANRARCPSAR